MNRAVGISYEGDKATALIVQPVALQEMGKLLDTLQRDGFDSGAKHFSTRTSVGNSQIDGHVYIRVLPTIVRVHIEVGVAIPVKTKAEEEEFRTESRTPLPDFLSGFVLTGTDNGMFSGTLSINQDDGSTLKIDTAHLTAFHPTALCRTQQRYEDSAAELAVRRLAVEPDSMWDYEFNRVGVEIGEDYTFPKMSQEEFSKNGVPDAFARADVKAKQPFAWPQYHRLRPTLWTGTMRKLVQYLMGRGKQANDAWYGRVTELLPGKPTGFYGTFADDAVESGVQIKYDYRSLTTDGVIFGPPTEQGLPQPFIVQVSRARGVVFAALPMILGTNTPAFRDYIKDLKDAEDINLIIEIFGGMPSGEALPRSVFDYEALERAGLITNALDSDSLIAGPYKGTAMSSAMGWAFSDNGTKAANVFYQVDEQGFHFTEQWELDFAITEWGTHTPTENDSTTELFEELSTEAGQTRWEELSVVERSMIFYKSLYTEGGGSGGGTIDRLHNHKLPPLIVGTAKMGRTHFGRLTSNGQPDSPPDNSAAFGSAGQAIGDATVNVEVVKGHPPTDLMKFYEPLFGPYLVSYDTTPANRNSKIDEDAPLFVCFHGEEKRWVRKFGLKDRNNEASTSGEAPDCQYGQSWEIRTTSGGTLVPAFYSSEYDDRGDATDSELVESHTVGNPVQIGWYPFSPGEGPVVARMWAAAVKLSRKRTSGAFLSTYVAAPMYDRAAYVMAMTTGYGGRETRTSEGPGMVTVAGGSAIAGGVGECGNTAGGWEICGRVEMGEPASCGTFAPIGISKCSPMRSIAFLGGALPPQSSSSDTEAYTVSKNEIRVVYAFDGTTKTKVSQSPAGGTPIQEAWYKPSPDEVLGYAEMQVYSSALGSAEVVAYHKDMSNVDFTVEGADGIDGEFCPIGVINSE